jgi:hypothetical protein
MRLALEKLWAQQIMRQRGGGGGWCADAADPIRLFDPALLLTIGANGCITSVDSVQCTCRLSNLTPGDLACHPPYPHHLNLLGAQMQEASWQNHAMAAAVPNRGIKYVRIHSLLNLVTINLNHTRQPGRRHRPADQRAANDEPAVKHPLVAAAFNWTLLERLTDMLVTEHNLKIGFELMGNPRLSLTSEVGVFTSFKESAQLESWRTMVATLARRMVARYGGPVVRGWKFEAWNEPDHICSSARCVWHRCDQADIHVTKLTSM